MTIDWRMNEWMNCLTGWLTDWLTTTNKQAYGLVFDLDPNLLTFFFLSSFRRRHINVIIQLFPPCNFVINNFAFLESNHAVEEKEFFFLAIFVVCFCSQSSLSSSSVNPPGNNEIFHIIYGNKRNFIFVLGSGMGKWIGICKLGFIDKANYKKLEIICLWVY